MCFFGGLFFRRREKANSSRTRQHTLSTLVTPTSVTFYSLKQILHPHLQKQPELFRYIYIIFIGNSIVQFFLQVSGQFVIAQLSNNRYYVGFSIPFDLLLSVLSFGTLYLWAVQQQDMYYLPGYKYVVDLHLCSQLTLFGFVQKLYKL